METGRAFPEFLEAIPDGVIVTDGSGCILYANRNAARLTGYEEGELTGEKVEVLVPDKLVSVHREHRSGYYAQPHARPMGSGLEISCRRKNGTVFPADIALSPFETESGRVVVATVRDVTERERARARLEAINEVAGAILERHDTDSVLALIARRARELAGAALASVATPEPDGETLVVRVAEGEHADSVRGVRFPAAASISGRVMRTRQSLRVEDARADERAHQPIVRVADVGPALFVPLAVKEQVFGTLAVANTKGGTAFGPEDEALVLLFASQASVALEQARVREQLERLALLEDRERIARDLHDGVIQSLFALGMTLQATEMVDDIELIRTRVRMAVDEIDQAIRDVRSYIFGLRPAILAGGQIEHVLTDLVASVAEGAAASVEADIDRQTADALASQAADVVQIAREALSNAMRHSGAGAVRLTLRRSGRYAVLEVEDDGGGFDVVSAQAQGRGLRNLRERAEALGGALEIASHPKAGTRLAVRLPL